MEIALNTQIRGARQLAAGRVTLTFVSPSGQHITLTAKARGPKESGTGWETKALAQSKVIFIEVPNETGFNDRVAKVTQARGFVPENNSDPARVWCAKQLLRYVAGEAAPEGLQILEEDRCGKCGRALTDPISIERGIGPECYGAETGSSHQTKQKAQDDEYEIQKERTQQSIEQRRQRDKAREARKADAEARGICTDPTLVDNVHRSRPQRTLGWREEKTYVAQARADVKPKFVPNPDAQLKTLPGSTFEDIFS